MASTQSSSSNAGERPPATRMSTSDQNTPPSTAGPKVFVSYRRRFDYHAASRLQEALVQKFGREFGDDVVFMDVEQIGGGEKFLPKIQAALKACNTFLALI